MILMASVVFSSSELRNKVCQICNACLDRDARKCFWEATKEGDRPPDKSVYWNFFSLFLIQNICCGY